MKKIVIMFLFVIMVISGCLSRRYTDDGKLHIFNKNKYYDQNGTLECYTIETKESFRYYDANDNLIQVTPK